MNNNLKLSVNKNGNLFMGDYFQLRCPLQIGNQDVSVNIKNIKRNHLFRRGKENIL